jgi:hypothetical protein
MSTRSLALAVLAGSVAVACASRTDLAGSGTTPAPQNVPDASTWQEAGSVFGTAAATSGDAMAEARSMVDEADGAGCILPPGIQVVPTPDSGIATSAPTTVCAVSLPPFNPCGPREFGLSCGGGGIPVGNSANRWVPASCRPQNPEENVDNFAGIGPLCCPCESAAGGVYLGGL